MANQFFGDRWEIDTASANMITNQSIFVKSIRWVGRTGEALIADRNGKTRWRSLAPDGERDLIELWWYEGFKCTVLDGGVLYITMK